MEDDDINRHPGINSDLIRIYFERGDIKSLTSLFDFLRRTTLRAESLSRAYQSQMVELHRRLEDIRMGANVKKKQPIEPTSPEPPQTKPTVARKPKGKVIDIDL
jgi:hypothetical protein